MDEIFLDISLPDSGKEETRLKKEGYVEKKYTRATAKEIEDAFKRYLLKQIIPARGITTPSQINALKGELNSMVSTQLYEISKNGNKIFKYKMYIPSDKLLKQREKAKMNENEIFTEVEEFAPENYGKEYTLKIKQNIKTQKNKPIQDLSNAFKGLKINNYAYGVKGSTGHIVIDKAFIESILPLNTNMNANNNNKNRNTLSTKALISGMLTSDLKFIRNVVNQYIAQGLNRDHAIYFGIVLANLPQAEFQGIKKEADKSGITYDFLVKLGNYLSEKAQKTGGKRKRNKTQKRR